MSLGGRHPWRPKVLKESLQPREASIQALCRGFLIMVSILKSREMALRERRLREKVIEPLIMSGFYSLRP